MPITVSLILAALLSASSIDTDELVYWVFFSDRGADVQQRLEIESERIHNSSSATRRNSVGLIEADIYDLEPYSVYINGVENIASTTIRTSSRYLNAVSMSLSPEAVNILLNEPYVSEIRAVGVSTFCPSEEIPSADSYGLSLSQLEQIKVLDLQQRGWTGNGVVIGMLDSGFDLAHPCLQSADVLATWDFVNNDSIVSWQEGDLPNQPSHGTKTFSIIAGYQPDYFIGGAFNASFLLAKTEDTSDEYEQEEDFWVAGLEWLEAGGADLVSSSLGYTEWYDPEHLDGNTAVTTIAADLAASRGLVVWNSAGNDGPGETTLVAPADGDSVFAVGAVDGAGSIVGFSSRGPTADGRIKPNGCARGTNATVASFGGTGYSSAAGTSFAAPLTSAAAACVKSAHPDWSMMDIFTALQITADRSDNPDNSYGYGIINALDAVKYNSIIGQVRRSDTAEPLAGITVNVLVHGTENILATTNESGYFAVTPEELGIFVATAEGWGSPIPVTGSFDENGIEITIFVDPIASSGSPTVYPNPSSESFYIGYDLATSGDVSLSIFTIDNQLVFFEERLAAPQGCYRAPLPGEAFFWNGLNEDNEEVSSGQYIALLKIGDSVELLNLALIRGTQGE